jgi:NADPH:quinone reductase-like Zn-dependent oxidoreductase
MMAARVHQFGAPNVIAMEQIDVPRPGEDEVLVRVQAAGVGPWDAWIRAGKAGGYAVQLAHQSGARVIASARDASEFVDSRSPASRIDRPSRLDRQTDASERSSAARNFFQI